MGKISILVSLALLLVQTTTASAITFVEGEEPDPFAEGEVCKVSHIASMGGYVYGWPSKFDFVFEPWVGNYWFCSVSGYVSYPSDFTGISVIEKTRISDFLDSIPANALADEKGQLQHLFDRMEAIYALRDRSLEERAYFLRARAWLYRLDPLADQYRKRALALHIEILETEGLAGFDLITNLYLVGFYTWKFGNRSDAEAYFSQAEQVKWKDETGEELTGAEYVNGLIQEVRDGKADDAVRFSQ